MKKGIIFWVIVFIFFIAYWKIIQIMWNNLPISPITNVLGIFTATIINIPISLISAEKTIAFLKKNL